MQTGNTLQPRFEYAQVFDIRVAGPIDSRMTISSAANINVELPYDVRFSGQLVWVDNENKFYYFNGGILNANFVPLIPDSVAASYKFVFVGLSAISDNDTYAHNLNTQDFVIQFFLDNKQITIDYEFLPFNAGAPTDHLNILKFKLASGQTVPAGVKIVILI